MAASIQQERQNDLGNFSAKCFIVLLVMIWTCAEAAVTREVCKILPSRAVISSACSILQRFLPHAQVFGAVAQFMLSVAACGAGKFSSQGNVFSQSRDVFAILVVAGAKESGLSMRHQILQMMPAALRHE